MREKSLRVTRQASAFVEKEGEATLAYWLQYRVSGTTSSMAVVFRPERCLFPRDKIALGHEHWEWDVTRGQFEPWLKAKGYVLRGEVVDQGWCDIGADDPV